MRPIALTTLGLLTVLSLGTCLPATCQPATATHGPTTLKPLQLSTAQLRSLTTPVTRDRQLAAIKKGPRAMLNLYNKLVSGPAAGGPAIGGPITMPDLAAWQAGIVLTPLAMFYGQVPGPDSASCYTQCAMIGGGICGASNLPTAASPLLCLYGAANYESVLNLGFAPPAVGGYMITFGVAGLNAPPNIQFSPGLNVTSVGVPVTSDQPVPGATHWTVLVSTSGSAPGELFLSLEVPFGSAPMPCTFSSVTIRKL